MNILFAGKSDFKYNRVQVLISGLKKLSSVNLDYYPIPKRSSFNKNDFNKKADWADFIYIPPFRHKDVGFLKQRTKTPIIFDPLISKYLTKLDYGHFWKLPIKYFLDKIPFQNADILLTDTIAHRDYFIKKFGLDSGKVFPLYIGADTNLFYPSENRTHQEDLFKVGFYGSFVPLQGVEKIIEAAYLLKEHADINFEIIGGGYTFKKAKNAAVQKQLKNIHFNGTLPYDQLNETINSFDVTLGIFGGSVKADLVIPNKVYHYAAIGKPIISRDTKGIHELFTNEENILLCGNTPAEIAASILRLKENSELRSTLGQNAAKLIKERYNEEEVAKRFLTILKTFKEKT